LRLDDAELRGTVARMEGRLGGEPLFPVYERLVERFGADLDDERDVLLSRAAVLMFLQDAAGDTGRPADG
jgi:hypothetical protein